ncbi:MAG: tRNA (adenosine(37)-N6)-threonylcarbamoyltransferase complex ATPase subunit type 1 TsaE [Bacteroidota bacterium]|nr:tRNA (adenosine(37)-N6)-threonylcarbamoyltransferase complex ATPase subunit type 1 TsaE [Bacteroidota bacterium]
MELIFSLNEIESVAAEIIPLLKNVFLIAFQGAMGAGKTTIIKAICKELGVKENVSSPTFSIINQYKTDDNKIIFHIDLYRVKDNEEAINAGVEECINSGEICFIEWPEKISFLPAETVNVFIEAVNENKRKLTVKLPLEKFIYNS